MKGKKLLALFITLLMLVSFSACDKENSSSSSMESSGSESQGSSSAEDSSASGGVDLSDIIPKETVELTIYTQLANYSGEQIGWSAEILKELFNVKVNIIGEADGTFATRMAAGHLGDIVVFGHRTDNYMDAVNAGLLLDWEEDDILQDYGSYINEHMQLALQKNRKISGNGKIYGIGNSVGTSSKEHESFILYPEIRWDLYEKIGSPEVNTLEDYIDILEKMVEIEPTSDTGKKTYGVSLFPDWDGNMVMMVKSTAGLYGFDEFGMGLYDLNNQVFEGALQEDGMYLRCLKFYNTLFQKGLLAPDSMTQTFGDMIEDYENGAAFWILYEWMGSGPYNKPKHLEEGKAMMPLPAKDQKNVVPGLNIYGGSWPFAIGSTTDYPELCMAIMNWLCTPEGNMIVNYGPRGLTWDYDSEGNPFLTELGLACQKDGKTVVEYGAWKGEWADGGFQHNNSTWARDAVNPEANGETYNYTRWKSYQEALEFSEIEQSWVDKTGYTNKSDYLLANNLYTISLGTEYSESMKDAELLTTWEQVKNSIVTGSWNAIYAKDDAEFDKIVSEMIETAKGYGYDECIEWCESEAAIKKQLENEVKSQG